MANNGVVRTSLRAAGQAGRFVVDAGAASWLMEITACFITPSKVSTPGMNYLWDTCRAIEGFWVVELQEPE